MVIMMVLQYVILLIKELLAYDVRFSNCRLQFAITVGYMPVTVNAEFSMAIQNLRTHALTVKEPLVHSVHVAWFFHQAIFVILIEVLMAIDVKRQFRMTAFGRVQQAGMVLKIAQERLLNHLKAMNVIRISI